MAKIAQSEYTLVDISDSATNILCGFTTGYSDRFIPLNAGVGSITPTNDGWARIHKVNTSKTESLRVEFTFNKVQGLTKGVFYTFLMENRNNRSNFNGNFYQVMDPNSAFFGNTPDTSPSFNTPITRGYRKVQTDTNKPLAQINKFVTVNCVLPPGKTIDVEVRISCYVGRYEGPYIPYIGGIQGAQGAPGAPGKNGANGAPGPAGAPGQAGVGVSNVKSYFLLSNTPTGVVRTSGTWSTTPLAPTLSQKYVWTYLETTLTNGTKQYSEPFVTGVYGDKGATGPNGATMYTWVKYADNATGQNMSDSPTNRRFLGIATNKPTNTKSTNPADYTWTPMYMSPRIGGMNMVRENWITNNGLVDFSYVGDIYSGKITAATNAWGTGLRLNTNLTTNKVSIGPGETMMISFEVMVDKDGLHINSDINNGFVGMTGGNDHDDAPKRVIHFPRPLVKNVWNRCYVSYTAKTTGYTELFDAGTYFGVVVPAGSVPVNVKFRRVMVENAETPGGYVKNIEDVSEQIQRKQSSDEYQLDKKNNEERLKQLADEAARLNKEEPEWFKAYKTNIDELKKSKDQFASDVKKIINEDFGENKISRVSEVILNEFTSRKIVQSPEGISIGEGNNRILINERGISIFAGNGMPAMVVTPTNIEIPNGTFIKTNRVGHYQEEEYGKEGTTNNYINVIRHVP